MARSTCLYWVNAFEREDKYTEIKSLIKEIFHTHKGSRRTLELLNRGAHINHKIVLRLMNETRIEVIGSHEEIPFKGKIGKIAPNILSRDFKAAKSNEKWVTDVKEFHLAWEKLYLSTILDLFNGEIIAYNIESRPVYPRFQNAG